MKINKYSLLLVALLLLCNIQTKAAKVSMPNSLSALPDETFTLPISLDNSGKEFTAFVLDVVVSEGVNFVKELNDDDEIDYSVTYAGRQKDSHMLSWNYIPKTKTLRIVGLSSQNESFIGYDGVLLNIKVKTDKSANGTVGISLRNVSFTDVNGLDYSLQDVSTKIRILNKYLLTFWDGESIIQQDSVAEDRVFTVPLAPQKNGFTFKRWDPELTENPVMPSHDMNYTAIYERNKYLASFIVDDTIAQKDSILYEETIQKPINPKKNGFTFVGWLPEVPETMPASDMTFTAQWERNKYLVTFIVEDTVAKKDSVLYEGTITKPADPVKEGYTFTGWQPEIPEKMPANDLTFTAQFSINQYTMTFVLNNGQENVVKTQDYASELTAPADPVKTGFTFKGWNPAVPATIPATDMTFTAQWERNKYLVTFIVEDTVAKKDSVLYEGTITKPADPVKEGYTFTGWQPEIPETMPANDLTFTAQFSINQYTMTFVLDNGEENVVKTQDYGTALTAPENLVKTGFTFKGWNPAVPATIPATDMTFTAQWERNKYKVTWIVDGQSTVNEVEYEATIVKPEDPVKEGYTFTGWDNEIPEKMPANDLTFTAQFKINTYAVIYMVKGEEWARDSLDYGATIVKRNYTAAEDETFNGWVSDAEYTTMPAHDVVYTAQITSGIVELQMNKQSVTIYRLDGTLVARNMKLAEAMKKLAKGVYIINGKKVNIK